MDEWANEKDPESRERETCKLTCGYYIVWKSLDARLDVLGTTLPRTQRPLLNDLKCDDDFAYDFASRGTSLDVGTKEKEEGKTMLRSRVVECSGVL